jgi:hypothetical protein
VSLCRLYGRCVRVLMSVIVSSIVHSSHDVACPLVDVNVRDDYYVCYVY